MYKLICILMACNIIVTFPLYVTAADKPLELFVKAKQTDPRYKAAKYEFEAVTFFEPQARAALLPSINADVTYSDLNQKISSDNPIYASGRSSYATQGEALALTLPLFRLSSWIGYGQAKLKVKQMGVNLVAAEQDLMLRVTTAYLAILAAQDALELAHAERDAIKRNLDLVQEKFRTGLAAKVGLHEAKARYAIKNADVVAAESELDDRLQAMREIVGEAPENLLRLDESIPLDSPEPAAMNYWIEAARGNNIYVELQKRNIEIAKEEVRKIKAGHLPSLELNARYNHSDTGGSLFGNGSDARTTDIGVRLTVPIYAGGMISAQTGEAVQRQYMVQEELEREVRQAERQARAAYQGVTSGIVRIDALNHSLVSTKSALYLRREGYKAGIETLLAVLDAERDFYATKRDAAKARYDYLFSRLKLKQAVGSLAEEDLAMIGNLLR